MKNSVLIIVGLSIIVVIAAILFLSVPKETISGEQLICGDGVCSVNESCPEDCETGCQNDEDCKMMTDCCGYPSGCTDNRSYVAPPATCLCSMLPFLESFDLQYHYCDCVNGTCTMLVNTRSACEGACETLENSGCPSWFSGSNTFEFWASECANYSCGCFGEDTCNTDPDCIIFSNSTSPCGTFDYSVDSVFCVTEAEAGPLRETIRERLAELYPNGMPMCSRPPFENTVSFVCKCANGTCHKERLVRSVAEYNAMEKEDYNTYYVKGYASEVQDCYCPPEAECSICAPYLILTDYRVDFHGGLIFSIDGPFSEEDLLVLADSVYQMEEADFELDAQYILGVLPVRNNTAELRSYEKI